MLLFAFLLFNSISLFFFMCTKLIHNIVLLFSMEGTWTNFILPYEHLDWSWLRPQLRRDNNAMNEVSPNERSWTLCLLDDASLTMERILLRITTTATGRNLGYLRSSESFANLTRHTVGMEWIVRGHIVQGLSFGDTSVGDELTLHRDNSPGGQRAGGELFWSDSSSFHCTCSPRNTLLIIY